MEYEITDGNRDEFGTYLDRLESKIEKIESLSPSIDLGKAGNKLTIAKEYIDEVREAIEDGDFGGASDLYTTIHQTLCTAAKQMDDKYGSELSQYLDDSDSFASPEIGGYAGDQQLDALTAASEGFASEFNSICSVMGVDNAGKALKKVYGLVEKNYDLGDAIKSTLDEFKSDSSMSDKRVESTLNAFVAKYSSDSDELKKYMAASIVSRDHVEKTLSDIGSGVGKGNEKLVELTGIVESGKEISESNQGRIETGVDKVNDAMAEHDKESAVYQERAVKKLDEIRTMIGTDPSAIVNNSNLTLANTLNAIAGMFDQKCPAGNNAGNSDDGLTARTKMRNETLRQLNLQMTGVTTQAMRESPLPVTAALFDGHSDKTELLNAYLVNNAEGLGKRQTTGIIPKEESTFVGDLKSKLFESKKE